MAPVVVRAGAPAHRALQALGLLALVAMVVLVPVVFDESTVRLCSQAAAFSIAILGLNIVTGWSGQISLGHSAFMGVGAYTTAILVADHSWSYFTTVPVAAVACFTVGILVGIPALRLRGLYLALATLGLAGVFPNLVNKLESITGGSNGKNIPTRRIRLNAPSWTGLRAREDAYIWVYALVVCGAVLAFVLARNMLRSRTGRALLALRDDAVGAAASGVHIARHKVLAFGISAAYAGVAGSLFMFTTSNATGTAYSLNRSVELLTGVVVGGLASLPGSALGGLLVIFLPEWAKDWGDGTLAGAVYGAALIAIVALYPTGLAGLIGRLRRHLVVVAPAPVAPTTHAGHEGPSTDHDEPGTTPAVSDA
jgi:branched-chain amino acid transport system permease protein